MRPLGIIPDLWGVRVGEMMGYEANVKLHLDTEIAASQGLTHIEFIAKKNIEDAHRRQAAGMLLVDVLVAHRLSATVA